MSDVEGNPPRSDIPVIWGDYNAVGLSDEANDNCIYSLHRETLKTLNVVEGMELFVFDDDTNENGQPEVFGYVCILEKVEWFAGEWRARPMKDTWYRGPKTWGGKNDI